METACFAHTCAVTFTSMHLCKHYSAVLCPTSQTMLHIPHQAAEQKNTSIGQVKAKGRNEQMVEFHFCSVTKLPPSDSRSSKRVISASSAEPVDT